MNHNITPLAQAIKQHRRKLDYCGMRQGFFIVWEWVESYQPKKKKKHDVMYANNCRNLLNFK